jgi:hypothetical protein
VRQGKSQPHLEQHQLWSKTPQPDRRARLTLPCKIAMEPLRLSVSDETGLWWLLNERGDLLVFKLVLDSIVTRHHSNLQRQQRRQQCQLDDLL